jgi:hypothetical protein
MAHAFHCIEGWVDHSAGQDEMEIWTFLLYRDSNSDPSVFQLLASYSGVYSTSNRNKYQKRKNYNVFGE